MELLEAAKLLWSKTESTRTLSSNVKDRVVDSDYYMAVKELVGKPVRKSETLKFTKKVISLGSYLVKSGSKSFNNWDHQRILNKLIKAGEEQDIKVGIYAIQMESILKKSINDFFELNAHLPAFSNGQIPDHIENDVRKHMIQTIIDLDTNAHIRNRLAIDTYEVATNIPNKFIKTLIAEARIQKENALDFSSKETAPTRIVFAGGGAKGFLYSGVISALEDTDLGSGVNAYSNITSVSGTSAGALTALPVAMGCSAAEIEEILENNNFALFFTESSIRSQEFGDIYKSVYDFEKGSGSSTLAAGLKGAIFGAAGSALAASAMKDEVKEINEYRELTDISAGEFSSKLFLARTKVESLMHMSSGDKTHLFEKPTTDTPSNVTVLTNHETRTLIMDEMSDEEINRGFEEIRKQYSEKNGKEISIGSDEIGKKRDFLLNLVRCNVRKQDRIEEFLKDVTYDKLKKRMGEKFEDASIFLFGSMDHDAMRNLTFEQADQLRKNSDFKDVAPLEINIAITELADSKGTKFISHMVNANNQEYKDMPIATACRISMNLPYAFEPIKYKGKSYTDGGWTNNVPSNVYENEPGNSVIINRFVDDNSVKFMTSLKNIFTPNINKEGKPYRSTRREYSCGMIMSRMENNFAMRNDAISPMLSGHRYNTNYIKTRINTTEFSILNDKKEEFLKQKNQVKIHMNSFISNETPINDIQGASHDAEYRYLSNRLSFYKNNDLQNESKNSIISNEVTFNSEERRLAVERLIKSNHYKDMGYSR